MLNGSKSSKGFSNRVGGGSLPTPPNFSADQFGVEWVYSPTLEYGHPGKTDTSIKRTDSKSWSQPLFQSFTVVLSL